jgi:signal transduction histidine kinase
VQSTFSAQPLRRQVLLVSGAIVLFLLGAMAWSGVETFYEREADVRQQAASVVTTAAAYLNQRLDGLDSLAVVLARYPAIRSLDAEASHALLAELLPRYPVILNMVVTDRAGLIRGSAVPLPPGHPDRFELPCLDEVLTTGQPCTSRYMIDALTRQPTLVLTYPIPGDDGRSIGTLDFALNLLSLQSTFASIPLPPGSVVTLTDRDSRVLVRSREAEKYVGTLSDTGRVADPRDVPRIRVMKGLDGIEQIFGNAVIPRGPWLLSVGIPLAVARERSQSLWRRNVLIAIAAILASVVLILFLANKISRPVAELTAAAQRIAAGDLSPPSLHRAPNLELGQLGQAFGTMAENLAQAHIALDRQVVQERRAREQVELLQGQVVRQERLAAVGLLVSGVAHELNNPLQAILGATELVERRARELPADVLDEIGFIQQQGARARDIIRNLSRFSRQEASPSTEVRLGDVVEAVRELRVRDLERRSVAFEVDDTSRCSVVAGFTELQQVVLNFVVNAEQAVAEAGRPGGRVVVRVRDREGAVRLEVADNGSGVNEADQSKLFQPFFTTKPIGQGTGLGLSVSYGIIHSYGGTIGYFRNEWNGATFYFDLPARPAAEARS